MAYSFISSNNIINTGNLPQLTSWPSDSVKKALSLSVSNIVPRMKFPNPTLVVIRGARPAPGFLMVSFLPLHMDHR